MSEVLTTNWFQMWKSLSSWLQMKFKLKVFYMEMLVLCQVTYRVCPPYFFSGFADYLHPGRLTICWALVTWLWLSFVFHFQCCQWEHPSFCLLQFLLDLWLNSKEDWKVPALLYLSWACLHWRRKNITNITGQQKPCCVNHKSNSWKSKIFCLWFRVTDESCSFSVSQVMLTHLFSI